MMALAQKVIRMDDHRSSGPQLEDGFVRIANELFDAVLSKLSSYRHTKIVLAIIRKTYGYGKKEDDITISQLAEITGIHRNNVGTALKELEEMNVIQPVRAGRHGLMIGINKHHTGWTSDDVKARGPGRKTIKLVADGSNQNDCDEQSKQLPDAIKTIETSNQNVAHNRQPQKTTPKDNPKREKSGKPAAQAMPSLPDWMPAKEWQDFVAHRIEIKKPVTATVASRLFPKIERLVAEGHSAAKLLDQSIINGWQDVFPKPETMADKPATAKGGKFGADGRGLVAGLLPGSFL